MTPSAPARDGFDSRPEGLSPEGLSTAEALRRREAVGPNLVVQRHRRSIAVQLLLRFGNPLVLLLLGAAALSGVTGDLRSMVVILAILAGLSRAMAAEPGWHAS